MRKNNVSVSSNDKNQFFMDVKWEKTIFRGAEINKNNI